MKNVLLEKAILQELSEKADLKKQNYTGQYLIIKI